MAKVTSFMYAANVIQDPAQGQLHIVNPLQVIAPVYIPSTYSFFVVFSISDFDIEKSHNVKIVFTNDKSPDKSIVETTSNFPPIPKNPKVELPKEYEGFISSIGFQNVVIEDEGLYKTSLYFDGEKIGEYEIYVTRAKP